VIPIQAAKCRPFLKVAASGVRLDHDDFGLVQSKIMNSDRFQIVWSGLASEKVVPTFSHPAPASAVAAISPTPGVLARC
jgi:hypothetical protein